MTREADLAVKRFQNWLPATFSFYFAQTGAGLTIFFLYILIRNGAASNPLVALVLGLFVAIIIVGLALMTRLALSMLAPHYMITAAPAFVLYYVTVHVALASPPTALIFGCIVATALVHLVLVWVLWTRVGEELELA